MGFLNWVRTLFGGSDGEPEGYHDFPDPEAQAAADEAENQNIYEAYHTGDAPWQAGREGGGDEPPEEPPEEPEAPEEAPEEPAE